MIRWLTAFVDMPAGVHDAGCRFWESVTGSVRSPQRGECSEFATLIPPDGDAYMRVQRVGATEPSVHLDVHVDDVAGAVRKAQALGATVVADLGHVIMASPGGFVFCAVEHQGESIRPAPFAAPGDPASRVDQLCIDIPASRFAAESAFWEAFTGLERRHALRPEFEYLIRPPEMPLRLLLQRLETDDARRVATGHLDIAGGSGVAELAARHQALGADLVRVEEWWTTLRDPAGLEYCLTSRDPVTGVRA